MHGTAAVLPEGFTVHSMMTAQAEDEGIYNDLVYVVKNGTVSITDYSGSDKEISIPKKINGKKRYRHRPVDIYRQYEPYKSNHTRKCRIYRRNGIRIPF